MPGIIATACMIINLTYRKIGFRTEKPKPNYIKG